MTKTDVIKFTQLQEQLEKAQADIQTLIDECNNRGEIINNQAQQLREKDAKITELYEKHSDALKQALDRLNAETEYKGKAMAYEARIAELEKVIENYDKIV